MVTYTVTCSPRVRRGQRISLLLGDREILTEPLPAGTDTTDTLTFRVERAPAGTWLVRLRVGGVDTLAFRDDVFPRAYDPQQQVTIQ